MDSELTLDDFFADWCRRYNVVATVEGGLKFKEASEAWRNMKQYHSLAYRKMMSAERRLRVSASDAEFFRAKAEYWLVAYQNERVKNHGDYARQFVRRPRMRRIILFLMRFG